MKKILIVLVAGLMGILAVLAFGMRGQTLFSPAYQRVEEPERPLDKYTIDNLSKTQSVASRIELGQVLSQDEDWSSSVFYFWVDGKKVSGLINLPKDEGKYPVVVMFRGYVDREKYTTGVGTARVGEALARAGFITLAPDFLGYGASDKASDSPIEERFQTYTTALTLISSVKNLNQALASVANGITADEEKIGIWGHSNGGQIALTVVEITGGSYPTVLWAPVSKPFPYSILYYTDEFDDHGKMLRRVIAEFEKDYDAELYSLTNYFAKIAAPLQLHQGSDDEAVPQGWSSELVKKLQELGKEVDYFTYPGDDHNLAQGGWSLAVLRSIDFYRSHFGE